MHLNCDFYLSRPLFDKEQLQGFQAVINEYLPDWSRASRVVARSQGTKMAIVGSAGDLCACLHSLSTTRRGIQSADLAGIDAGLSFFLFSSDSLALADGNHVALEILDWPTIEGRATAAWVRDFFEEVSTRLPTRFAKAHLVEEFYAKNMHDDSAGAWALNAGFLDGLPGLYWLNYFGPTYCDLIGRERLLSAPATEVKAAGDGVLIGLDPSPRAWTTPQYQQLEQAVIEHLGKQYFFSRHDPDRETVVPDFETLARMQAKP